MKHNLAGKSIGCITVLGRSGVGMYSEPSGSRTLPRRSPHSQYIYYPSYRPQTPPPTFPKPSKTSLDSASIISLKRKALEGTTQLSQKDQQTAVDWQLVSRVCASNIHIYYICSCLSCIRGGALKFKLKKLRMNKGK